EAAAATIVEVVVERVSAPSFPSVIVLDKPFIFFIQEKHSGAILFMGKLGDPSKL
uniref:serpin family protein n=1 Tax=Aquiflexum sp. TaxID=1872584 RepID=UPI0035933EBE